MYIEVYHEYSGKQNFFDIQSQYFSVNYFQFKIASWVDETRSQVVKTQFSVLETRSWVVKTRSWVLRLHKYLWGISIYELGVDETERSSRLKPDPPDLLPHTYRGIKPLGRGTTQPPTTPWGKMKISRGKKFSRGVLCKSRVVLAFGVEGSVMSYTIRDVLTRAAANNPRSVL